jgi:hypothetical protein
MGRDHRKPLSLPVRVLLRILEVVSRILGVAGAVTAPKPDGFVNMPEATKPRPSEYRP